MTLQQKIAWAVWTTALTVVTIPVRADKDPRNLSDPAIITNNSTLQQSLNRLYTESASWRAAVKEVEKLGRKAVVVTTKQVRVKDPKSGRVRAFDSDVLAEVQPLAEVETRVDAVVIVVNLDMLVARMQERLATVRDLEDDLDRVVAHEVYGHAIPYLLAGDLSGKCADPAPNERAEDACAIKRENQIRAEMRLGQRRDYGLDGLALARRYRN